MMKKYVKIIAALCVVSLLGSANFTKVSATTVSDASIEKEESIVDDTIPYASDQIIVVMEEDGAEALAEYSMEVSAAVAIGTEETSAMDTEATSATDPAEAAVAVEENLEGSEDALQFAVVELEEDMSVKEAVELYSDLPGVAFAQPNYIYEPEEVEGVQPVSEELQLVGEEQQPISEGTLSAETSYSQWYLNKLNMTDTWALMDSVPTNKVRTVVLDTGIDTTHPDLKANINIPLCVNSSTNPVHASTEWYKAHGTHVAGIIGAVNDNGFGVQGMSDNRAELVSVCVSDGSNMYTSYVARGIDYAISIGTKVMNVSLGVYSNDTTLENAMRKAYNAGIFVVTSAGNNGTDAPHYPSGYSTCIGVINTNQSNLRSSSSNYGTDNFISAPGNSITSTYPVSLNSYVSSSGTSMASAVAAGLAVDIYSVNPNYTIEQVKNIMASTATDIYASGFDADSGWGIINPKEAMSQVTGSVAGTVDFVKRLYTYCLNREADAGGLDTWVGRLEENDINGAQAAQGFLFSDEFKNRNTGNSEYVDILYRVFMDREADTEGKAYWINKLENGMSRLYVMNGFSGSTEFNNICSGYGIEAGNAPSGEVRDQNEGVTGFVARLYTKALGRDYDIDGLNDWCGRIMNGSWSAYQVSTDGFFHSQEFGNKHTGNGEFVKILYRTYLDREYDQAGYNYWVAKLNQGESRDSVIAGFANSQEFANIMKSYGLSF